VITGINVLHSQLHARPDCRQLPGPDDKSRDWSSPRSEPKASGWSQSAVTKTHVLFLVIECNGRHIFSSSSVVSRAFSVLYVYSKFGRHPHSYAIYSICAKFCLFRGLHCRASPWRKITYSSHSPSLFDAPGTEAIMNTCISTTGE